MSENIKDYPDIPIVKKTNKTIKVIFNKKVIAETSDPLKVMQKNLFPVYYIPKKDFKLEYLKKIEKTTLCIYKGTAEYYNLIVDDKEAKACVYEYSKTKPGYEILSNYLSLYPAKVDEIFIDSEKVQKNIGAFTGGWVTSEIEY
ncbi:hypothetical protein OSSY52_11290 [Tepiditoga spiralis]|uniref:DUF427 domain-containing protein n=1 Tax=Tepiditoga spiralis TaxID=2108365 RepID=A0A7G1G3I5_9BACT|nr:DUF427 domain-containing protein [Tepiditoga spiralis]BBE30988.1 hypothetical protein OSSY52_11290 [Tepiditoga spiralis]